MKRILILLPAALALMVACTQAELERGGTPTEGEIRLTVGIDGARRTKAPIDGDTGLQGASFLVKESTGVPASLSGGAHFMGDVATGTGQVTFTSATPVYNRDGRNSHLVAYYPGKAPMGNTVQWAIDGRTDIMLTNAAWDAGTFSAPNTGATGTKLRLSHQLARVEVVMKAEENVSLDIIKKAWGDIRKIEFMDAPSTLTCSLTAGTPSVSTANPTDIQLWKDYDTKFTPIAIPPSDNTAVDAVAMLAPVTATSTASFRLRVTASGDGSTPVVTEIPVSLNNTFASLRAGYTHTVSLVFKAFDQKVEVAASSIDAWEGGNPGDIGFLPPNPPEPPEPPKPPVAPAAVGNYYYADGSISAIPGTNPKPVGVVYWVEDGNNRHYLVCAISDIGKQWCYGIVPKVGASSGYADFTLNNISAPTSSVARLNGAVNTALLKKWIADPAANTKAKTLADWPAFQYCDQLGSTLGCEGWYLPAPNEMQYLYCVWNGLAPTVWTGNGGTANSTKQAEWNKKFTDVSGGNGFSGVDYWCATEHSGGAWNVYFQTGATGYNSNPNTSNKARCIKEIK